MRHGFNQPQRPRRTLYTRCCDGIASADQLREMYDGGREITFRTFALHTDISSMLGELGYATGRSRGLRLQDDMLVRYFKSAFRGQPCYYMVHSAIDHIFLFPDQVRLLSES